MSLDDARFDLAGLAAFLYAWANTRPPVGRAYILDEEDDE